MSNTQVGNIYSSIIGDVIESSRVDFEEGGVDEHVLEELRMGWQQKLSQLGVANFPWDPKPEPTPAMSNPPTVPSNAMHYPPNMGTPPMQQQQQQQQGGLTMPQMGQSRIKMEPGLDMAMHPNGNQPQQPYQNGPPMNPATQAADRAQAHLHQTYGPRASASINAIQSARQQAPNGGQQMTQQQFQMMQQQQQQQQQRAANGMQQQQQQQQQQRGPGQGQVQGANAAAEQYKIAMARQAAGQMQQAAANAQHGQNNLGGAQTDGAGDEVESMSVIKQFGPNGEESSMGRVEIDNLLRSKIEAMGTRMEGGGLMLPLKQASTSKSRKNRVKSSRPDGAMVQGDGVDDDTDVKDEEVDEDAINSDLDDPDDTVNDEEDDDEGMGHIMLCMYDKVQRVKNKWKCVMKDGVLTVNGKEYVFHKASGEYEW